MRNTYVRSLSDVADYLYDADSEFDAMNDRYNELKSLYNELLAYASLLEEVLDDEDISYQRKEFDQVD